MSLSDSIRVDGCVYFDFLHVTDVKRFIKELQNRLSKANIDNGFGFTYLCEIIDELAGEALI